MLEDITPLILTLDEEANIERTLAKLRWARDVVVVDSGSKDATRTIVQRFENARCVEHPFASHAEQWSFGLTGTRIRTEWVLALDADYMVPEALVEELSALSPDPDVMGYEIGFRYCVLGRNLHGTLYPPVVVLYRREAATYVQDGHTQRVRLAGKVGTLRSKIIHDDRKPLSRWLASQDRYARLEAEALCARPWSQLAWSGRLRKLLVVMPGLVFLYCLTIGRGFLDGRAGLYYALQRAVAEALIALALIERRGRAELPRDEEEPPAAPRR